MAVHSIPFQFFFLSLVVLDALIVLMELLLDVGAFSKYIHISGTHTFIHTQLDIIIDIIIIEDVLISN